MTATVANPNSPRAVALWDPVAGTPLGTGASPLPVVPSAGYTAISTNGTTVVKSSAGIYAGLVIQTAGAASNTLVIYDNTSGSGQVLAGTSTNISTGSYAASPSGIGVRVVNGITVVSATGTAAVGLVLWD